MTNLNLVLKTMGLARISIGVVVQTPFAKLHQFSQ